ncbi:MAG: 50S ribosomal protein L29 [Candidatus Jacksonbacteria bacterium]|jgi:large subunit ribosomal protein L29|nr:50S ribosomal protein L29 [Candidatus Jacksonbacteria bacterium]MBT6034077.1 50S ribosomal protein L29 [Candidatus Jacksonbacteria bacterium]MBT6301112.1 50S ribosomal protein L29 [Candidatus Jacksonbacteria bacterium]MBT6757305.1 50S ribosomal protein L29 [Candidatus Jacksonbacteria bacterium]MBT6955614.1 50S ribosomal protein L29 [Candidatus Jacksonbacteria bacterium]
MNMKELRVKKPKELETLMHALTADLKSLRFQVASGQLKTVRDIRKKRKTIAQIKTLLKGDTREVKK